ncbi:MAG: phenylalanine--tRNA ligase subunit alpha, partial [Dehalococcoidales bacterium]|nr:phenylalanine--tRNA ligase subunit alpha [Dehalococcoidales bacterium]
MLDRIEGLKNGALQELEVIRDARELEAWRVKYLGRKSDLTGILRGLAQLPIEERRNVGAKAGELKAVFESTFEQKKQALTMVQTEMATRVSGAFDVTLPGRKPPVGHLHVLTQTIQEISDIFVAMGFQVAEGPEVEYDYYNFEALNIPAEHPSRDNMSTFWVDAVDEKEQHSMLLHTHTTSVTARTLA